MLLKMKPVTNTTSYPNNADAKVERLCVSLAEAATMLGLSQRKVYALTQTGELPCKRVGRRVLYSVEILRRFVNES